mmetsp:Transcript_6587/g.8942  ORF Transcript_6587/g.8942 Transcript_6587/m.8942 type:complete len:86 (+) Transcript_6587:292-549(+)
MTPVARKKISSTFIHNVNVTPNTLKDDWIRLVTKMYPQGGYILSKWCQPKSLPVEPVSKVLGIPQFQYELCTDGNTWIMSNGMDP